jgi:hypothetical protein
MTLMLNAGLEQRSPGVAPADVGTRAALTVSTAAIDPPIDPSHDALTPPRAASPSCPSAGDFAVDLRPPPRVTTRSVSRVLAPVTAEQDTLEPLAEGASRA